MQVICGPYEQRDDGAGQLCWHPPANAIGAIDLRSLADQSEPGIGLFALEDGAPVARDFVRLGAWGDQLDGRAIQHLETRTGMRGLAQGTIDAVLWQMLVDAADPTGQAAAKPLMPERHRLRAHFAGITIGGERFNPAVHRATLEQYREGYRIIRRDTLDGLYPENHHRRVLDYWGEKLGMSAPQDVLIPADLPRETRLPHATTLTESFNKADASTLGPDQTWTVTAGVLEVVSNRGRSQTGISHGRVDAALSGADMYCQFGVYLSASHDGNCYCGPSARNATGATVTLYVIRHFNTTNGQTFKYVAGTFTAIGTNTTSASWTDGKVSRLEASGSSIIRKYDGSTENTATDTSIDGVTVGTARGGIWSRNVDANNYLADDWEAGDLAGAPAGNPHYYYHQQQAATA